MFIYNRIPLLSVIGSLVKTLTLITRILSIRHCEFQLLAITLYNNGHSRLDQSLVTTLHNFGKAISLV